jgi:hypothetical protein
MIIVKRIRAHLICTATLVAAPAAVELASLP